MRAFALAALLLVLASIVPPPAAGATCGRYAYPDAGRFAADAVVDATRWDALVARGGFTGGVEGTVAVQAALLAPGANYTVVVEETETREYVGGEPRAFVAVRLTILEARPGGPTEVHAFATVSFAGRGGGNLTLAPVLDGAAVDLFWRWAYLPCDEAFPNSYYVFHARLDGGQVVADNVLVYFEAPRPRRGPPADLILLVSAGIAVSVIFLIARRALREK